MAYFENTALDGLDAAFGNSIGASRMHGIELPDSLASISPEELAHLEAKLVRKIDIRLLPMLIIMYIMNYLDRNNIAAARPAGKVGLEKQLGLSSTQFNVS